MPVLLGFKRFVPHRGLSRRIYSYHAIWHDFIPASVSSQLEELDLQKNMMKDTLNVVINSELTSVATARLHRVR